MTSQQVCVRSTGRLLPQGLEDGQRALRRRAGRNTESPKVWRHEIRSFGLSLKPWRRREEKETAVLWRTCYKESSHWERMTWRSCSTEPEEKWERPKGRCQEEEKEEGTVKMNRSKVQPVSSWCYQRKAGSMKALQRAARVWGANGECGGAGSQVQQKTEKDLGRKPRRVDFRWKKKPHWGTCEWKWD